MTTEQYGFKKMDIEHLYNIYDIESYFALKRQL